MQITTGQKNKVYADTVKIVAAAVGASTGSTQAPLHFPDNISEFVRAVYDALLDLKKNDEAA